MKRSKQKIDWKQGQKPSKNPKRFSFVADVEFDASVYSPDHLPTFTPGELFVVESALEVIDSSFLLYPPPHPYVRTSLFGFSPFKKGSIAVYAGKVKVEEDTNSGSVLRHFRNSFVINGSRYLTVNVNNFKFIG